LLSNSWLLGTCCYEATVAWHMLLLSNDFLAHAVAKQRLIAVWRVFYLDLT